MIEWVIMFWISKHHWSSQFKRLGELSCFRIRQFFLMHPLQSLSIFVWAPHFHELMQICFARMCWPSSWFPVRIVMCMSIRSILLFFCNFSSLPLRVCKLLKAYYINQLWIWTRSSIFRFIATTLRFCSHIHWFSFAIRHSLLLNL